MKVHDVEQNSDAWLGLRLGIPTASEFGKIITSTGKPSTQAAAYQDRLIAEWLTGASVDGFSNKWTDRGHEIEPEARAFYAMERDMEVSTVGFITRDDGLAGASPDGVVEVGGLLEIKSPAAHTQVKYLLGEKVPTEYRVQTQGQLYIAERDWSDFLSYHPDLPPVLIRVERDEPFIKALREQLDKFIAGLLAKREALIARGISPALNQAA